MTQPCIGFERLVSRRLNAMECSFMSVTIYRCYSNGQNRSIWSFLICSLALCSCLSIVSDAEAKPTQEKNGFGQNQGKQ
jgi:hypothetical protein